MFQCDLIYVYSEFGTPLDIVTKVTDELVICANGQFNRADVEFTPVIHN